MMAGIPFMASAADTLDMKASLAEGTCTIQSNNINLILPTFSVADIEHAAHSDVLSHAENDFIITDCPSSLNSITVAATYDTDDTLSDSSSYASDYAHPAFTGSANGFMLTSYRDHDGKNRWKKGVGYSFGLVNGAVNIPVDISADKSTSKGRDKLAAAGNFNSNMTFNFQFD
ncbi:hypothetical protein BIW59_22645 [Salmonella enterica]|nr:hypothetical protein [Salmonella enterica]EBQ5236457.1 hypothetical protein [Salmonella enterica]